MRLLETGEDKWRRMGMGGHEEDRRLTQQVALSAELPESPQLVLRQLTLHLSRRLVQPPPPPEHPVRRRVDDGKLEQVQGRP